MKTDRERSIECIIKCAEKVYDTMGYGFKKSIYQHCLAIEFADADILFEREVEQIVYYKGIAVDTHSVDFVINDLIILELGTSPQMSDGYLTSINKYMDVLGFKKGVMINFGVSDLQYKLVSKDQRTPPPVW